MRPSPLTSTAPWRTFAESVDGIRYDYCTLMQVAGQSDAQQGQEGCAGRGYPLVLGDIFRRQLACETHAAQGSGPDARLSRAEFEDLEIRSIQRLLELVDVADMPEWIKGRVREDFLTDLDDRLAHSPYVRVYNATKAASDAQIPGSWVG